MGGRVGARCDRDIDVRIQLLERLNHGRLHRLVKGSAKPPDDDRSRWLWLWRRRRPWNEYGAGYQSKHSQPHSDAERHVATSLMSDSTSCSGTSCLCSTSARNRVSTSFHWLSVGRRPI